MVEILGLATALEFKMTVVTILDMRWLKVWGICVLLQIPKIGKCPLVYYINMCNLALLGNIFNDRRSHKGDI